MSPRPRTTFSKRHRENAKKEKKAEKAERRARRRAERQNGAGHELHEALDIPGVVSVPEEEEDWRDVRDPAVTEHQGPERRKYRRKRATISAWIRALPTGREQVGKIHNLSPGGAFIEMLEPFSGGTAIRLQFSLPHSPPLKPHFVDCRAEVVWSSVESANKTTPTGVGAKMPDLGPTETRVLAQLAVVEDPFVR